MKKYVQIYLIVMIGVPIFFLFTDFIIRLCLDKFYIAEVSYQVVALAIWSLLSVLLGRAVFNMNNIKYYT